MLRAHAERSGERTILKFLGDAEDDVAVLTYAALDTRARAIAQYLHGLGARGERALVLHAPGLEYIAALFGCFYAGVIAVPAYPPRLNRSVHRLRDIVADAQARFALTSTTALARIQAQEQDDSRIDALQWIATDTVPVELANDWHACETDADAIALLQYTSGSTSAPKGVVLSHAHLLQNVRELAALRDPSIEDRFVSWLPPYHDMGLIGAILLPLYMGTDTVLLSPAAFLQRPYRWLHALTQFGGTISGGPNFAYELCMRRISDAQKQTLDLSRWRVAFCGAERVRAETLERFSNAFAAYGFKRRSFAACYGLAEATLGVSFSRLGEEPIELNLDERDLSKGVATPSATGTSARALVACGEPLGRGEIIIVDPERRERCADNVIGEIWVRSASIALGYWRKPELSEEIFRARLKDAIAPTYLRTGDLGFLRDKQLFVTGRIKDLIVMRGLNYYPEDIEHTVDRCHARLRAGCGVAFSIDVDDEERLVLVYEIDTVRDVPSEDIIAAARSAVAEAHQLQVYDLALVPPGSVPKTSSGKLQRSLSRRMYLTGELEIIARMHRLSANTGAPIELIDQVCQLMRDVLGVEIVGPDDDFFWLGGHSLMATQLASRIRDVFGVELPLRTVFLAPTARGLASHIVASPTSACKGPTARIAREGELPLSFSQERMWLLHQLDPESAAYNVAGAALVEGEVNLTALQAALDEIVVQHEILRTNYCTRDGRPSLKLSVHATIPLEQIDLRQDSDPQARAMNLASIFASKPFDIARDMLARAVLYRIRSNTYVLSICMHHLVTDAWSLGMFARDLLKFYDAFSQGMTPPRELRDIQYIDYAHWQRNYLDDAKLRPDLMYWQAQLAGAEALELPTDHPRSERHNSRGAVEPLPLSVELFEAVTALARAEGTTPFMVLLTAFEVLLHRYTQRSDLVVGIPVANRNWLAAEHVMGTLVNTLPVRLRLNEDSTFQQLLARVKETMLDAYAHQDMPFEKLISSLAVERRAGESPLVRVMFDFQNAPMPGRSEGPIRLRPLVLSRGASQFDLSLMILDTEFGRLASIEYSTALFEARTVRRLLAHFIAILEAAVSRPTTAITEIPLLSTEERAEIVTLSTNSGALPQPAPDLYGVILNQMRQTPRAVAVSDQNRAYTYAQLQSRVLELASRMRSQGVGAGDRVAICLERSNDLLVSVLASLHLGAPYIPLDPRHPQDRIAHILANGQAKVVLTESALLPLSFGVGLDVLCVDAADEAMPRAEVVAGEFPPQHPAYIIYTSGSTGRPKGVEVSRGALSNFLRSMRHTPGITADDRLLAVTTLAFDIAGLELLLPITVGASVHIASNDEVADGRRLLQRLKSNAPTMMQATPATWSMLIDAGWQRSKDLCILCGGEALKPALADALLERARSLWNMYGPTETTIWSALHRVTRTEPVMPIGKPIDATSLYVLDHRRRLVPQGVAGEIYIGGAGIANGYFRNAELTVERFLQDPFVATEGRMYRTGDAGRWRGDGVLEYLGRLDHQIKVRGFRIEPAEIEQAMKQLPRVRDALVIAHETSPGDTRLVGYYTYSSVKDDADLRDELVETLRRQLPSYMIPSSFVPLAAFPQTPNGKIDRAALPAPTEDSRVRESADAFVAPRTALEKSLQQIWDRVLNVTGSSVRDDFFRLGGHSLLAVRLFAAIERELGVALPLATLFKRPTIEYLAECIALERKQISPTSDRPSVRGSQIVVPLRETGAQPPLFCIHGAGGQVLNFWAIAQRFGSNQPVYALQARGVDGKQAPYDSIEEVASQYLAELRKVQSQGPYYLSGYCGGGWIAFEMARQLRANGESVAMLLLLDSYGPRMPPVETGPRKWIQNTFTHGVPYLWERTRARVSRDWDTVSASTRIAFHRARGEAVPHELRDGWLTSSFLDVASRYYPGPYDGKLTLLVAKDAVSQLSSHTPEFGWEGLASGGVEVHQVPGTHHTLTNEPHVTELVSTMLRCMGLDDSNTAV